MEIITKHTDNLGVERNLFGVPAINLTKTKLTNKRQYVLQMIIDEINKERKGTKFKPVYPKSIAIKTSHLSIQDLEYFFSICSDYKNRCGSFSKCFYGALKNKNG